MLCTLFDRHNVLHLNPSDGEGVSDQPAMASPRQYFRTHDSSLTVLGQPNELVDAFRKLLRLHVVRKSSEGGVPPTHVRGIRPGMTQAAQLLHRNEFYRRFLRALG